MYFGPVKDLWELRDWLKNKAPNGAEGDKKYYKINKKG